MSRLVPCSSCRRHVRRNEGVCPFCAAPVPITTLGLPPARPAPPGTKRAVLFAMGISLAASACETENATPIYGAPNVPLGGSSGASGSGNVGGSAGNGGNAGDGGSSGSAGSSAGAASEPADAGNGGDAATSDAGDSADAGEGDAGDADAAP